jgi:L-aminopeptidase/D-esterase-like protein
MAERACIDAADGPVPQGNAGAGWGATVGKLFGPGLATKAGQGTASLRTGGIVVAALMVVNAVGDVVDPQTGEVLAGARAFVGSLGDSERRLIEGDLSTPTPGANTTIGVVATNAALTKEQANYLADVAHDGLARAIRPAHTILDGDTIFVLATGAESVDAVRGMVALGVATVRVVERAVVAAVTHAVAAGGLPAGRPADHPG